MSEQGVLRIVVEGEDARRFHEGLMDFIAASKENPEYRIDEPSGEVYWRIGSCWKCFKEGEATCIDCYADDGSVRGLAAIIWDSYEMSDGLLRLSAYWTKSVDIVNLGLLWIDNNENYFFEFESLNWGIVTNDAESKHFEKVIEVMEYDRATVPADWDKDWDKLSFDERVALCDTYDVIYTATRVIT